VRTVAFPLCNSRQTVLSSPVNVIENRERPAGPRPGLSKWFKEERAGWQNRSTRLGRWDTFGRTNKCDCSKAKKAGGNT